MQVENLTNKVRVTIPLKRGKLKAWMLVPWMTLILFEDGRLVWRWNAWLN